MTPLPFPLGSHVRTTTIQLCAEVGLVLLLGDVGLVGALWCVRGRWTDAPIGRA
jgi:hypothetical protein